MSFLLPTLVQAPRLHNPRSSSPSLKPLCCNCFPYSCLLTSGRLSFYNFNTWIELHLFSWHPSFQPSLPNCSVLAGTPCSLPRTGPSRYQILEPASQSIISSSHHKLPDSYGVCGFVPVMALDFWPRCTVLRYEKPRCLLSLVTRLKTPWSTTWSSLSLAPSCRAPILHTNRFLHAVPRLRVAQGDTQWCVSQGLSVVLPDLSRVSNTFPILLVYLPWISPLLVIYLKSETYLFPSQQVNFTFLSLRRFRAFTMNSLVLFYNIQWSHPNYPLLSFSCCRRQGVSPFSLLSPTTNIFEPSSSHLLNTVF